MINFCIQIHPDMILIGFDIQLFYYFLPKKSVIPEQWIRTQKINLCKISEKGSLQANYWIFDDIMKFGLIIFQGYLIIPHLSVNYGFSEDYLFSIFIWVFIFKDATVEILMMMVTIISITIINFSIREKDEYSSNIFRPINFYSVFDFIISYSQREKRENYKS
jgi:hypothetical protein